MTLIHLDKISRYFGANEVLVDLSWQVDEGNRIGLIGPNGCGKTTLVRVIAGELEPDRGMVHRKKEISVGYLSQEAEVIPGHTVHQAAMSAFRELISLREELKEIEGRISGEDHQQSTLGRYGQLRDVYERRGGYTFEREAKAALYGLGFDSNDMDRPAENLSGGQKSRLSLARQLVRKPDLLLLDEPTNHLDLQAVEWLEDFLSDYSGGVIIISHDRYFLDRSVSQIVELEQKRLVPYAGNYTAYVREKQNRLERQRKRYDEQQAFVKRTEEFIRKNIAGQKTRQAQSRRKFLERLERVDRPIREGKGVRVDFAAPVRAGDQVLNIEGVSKSYNSHVLFKDLTFSVLRGDRVGIVGPNGVGKTTLLKILAGDIPADGGKIHYGRRVDIQYYDQESEGLNTDNTILDEIRSVKPLEKDGDLRGFLGRFLFSEDKVDQQVGSLSGGEGSRLALAKLILSRPNLLLLDEPTNHLDIPSRTTVEEALQDFEGTVIAVSHDRYFLNLIAKSILYMDGSSWHFYRGNYDDMKDRSDRDTSRDSTGGERKIYYKQRRFAQRERERNLRRFAQIEEEIVSLEGQILELDEEMGQPEVAFDWGQLGILTRKKEVLRADMDRLYEEWSELDTERVEQES